MQTGGVIGSFQLALSMPMWPKRCTVKHRLSPVYDGTQLGARCDMIQISWDHGCIRSALERCGPRMVVEQRALSPDVQQLQPCHRLLAHLVQLCASRHKANQSIRLSMGDLAASQASSQSGRQVDSWNSWTATGTLQQVVAECWCRKIFRKCAPGEWGEVVATLALDALRHLLDGNKAQGLIHTVSATTNI